MKFVSVINEARLDETDLWVHSVRLDQLNLGIQDSRAHQVHLEDLDCLRPINQAIN